MRVFWFLVRDKYGITWLTDYVENMSKGLKEIGEEVKYTTRNESEHWKELMKPDDVLIITDFDDMDLVEKIPPYVLKVSHGHGVALSWIANNWKGEIDREKFFYDQMDMVTVNTKSQEKLIYVALNCVPHASIIPIGYPIDYDKVGSLDSKKKKKIVVAQRWDWDAQQELCMEILEPFITNDMYEVVILTPTHLEYAIATVGEDTVEKWVKGADVRFKVSQREFWNEARDAKVFLTTGNHHTLNLSLIESAWLGCEVVCPDKYPYRDYLQDAYWYEPYCVKEAQRSIISAMTSTPKTKMNFEQFTYRTVAEKLVKAVNRL